MYSAQQIHFEDRRRSLLPTLAFCGLFFAFYHAFLIIPRFGVRSEIFLIDNLGGLIIVAGFLLSYTLARWVKREVVLSLPSLATLVTVSLFLAHERLYAAADHLWLSAQIIGIVLAISLGSPRWNTILFFLNITIPPLIALQFDHLDAADVVQRQAVVYFASLVSIFLAHNSAAKKNELLRARDEAQSAARVRSEFLANMSHEIRTPLNGILGMISLLKDSPMTARQQDMLRTAEVCGDGLLVVINDILDLSKIESGKVELEVVDFDLSRALMDCAALVRQKAENKGLTLTIGYPDAAPRWFRGDVTRLSQIVVNFLSNAVKFTESGGVDLTVEVEEAPAGACQLTIRVKDTGIGIHTDSLPRLFKDFSQADSSTTRKYGGTGLGLSICAQLAELMGGSVFVESVLGEGSTFGFRVALSLGEGRKLEVVPSNERVLLSDRIQHRILVVEDNSVNQKVARMMLKRLGYDCIIVGNGQEALDEIERAREPYTVVFMDVHMPVMDGFEATRRLIARYGNSGPPVVAMTANALVEDRARCAAAGMQGFVSKPISTSALWDALVSVGSAKTAARKEWEQSVQKPAAPANASVDPWTEEHAGEDTSPLPKVGGQRL